MGSTATHTTHRCQLQTRKWQQFLPQQAAFAALVDRRWHRHHKAAGTSSHPRTAHERGCRVLSSSIHYSANVVLLVLIAQKFFADMRLVDPHKYSTSMQTRALKFIIKLKYILWILELLVETFFSIMWCIKSCAINRFSRRQLYSVLEAQKVQNRT